MKRICFLLVVLLCSVAATDDTPQKKYIERYSALAVEEMYRSGIPASITLAQGLLESGYGLSELALKSNNHFGIKCHNTWQGAKVYHDDDAKGECFRKYETPEESFRDHSDFLRYRDRYRFLFDLEITDYQSWAHGLKKAGYATDPKYPSKLIRLIEEYSLYEYDTRKPKEKSRSRRKAAANHRKQAPARNEEPVVETVLPESPAVIEQVRPLTGSQKNVFSFSLSREMYSQNGVAFIYAAEGDTYRSIAKANNLFLRELLKFNDLVEEEYLAPGTVVYLQKKKNMAPVGLDRYVVEGPLELRDIAQRFAIRLDKLCLMNGINPDHVLREGDIISLR